MRVGQVIRPGSENLMHERDLSSDAERGVRDVVVLDGSVGFNAAEGGFRRSQ